MTIDGLIILDAAGCVFETILVNLLWLSPYPTHADDPSSNQDTPPFHPHTHSCMSTRSTLNSPKHPRWGTSILSFMLRREGATCQTEALAVISKLAK